MSIPIKLEVFEGPLDLLLHLIDKNQLNIYDIPIVHITDQYLLYIQQMEEKNMEIMSEFIEMAATLLSIKSKMLLPSLKEEEEEEEDPREALVEKLIEYKKYKHISSELKLRHVDAEKIIFKGPTIPAEVLNYEEKISVDELLGELNFQTLFTVFHSLMKKQRNRVDPIRSEFGKIKKEDFTVQDKIDAISALSKEYQTLSFIDLIESSTSKVEMIVTFLAILELMKMGKIKITQEYNFGDIIIEFVQ